MPLGVFISGILDNQSPRLGVVWRLPGDRISCGRRIACGGRMAFGAKYRFDCGFDWREGMYR
jgi:hypothetical protein